jgi:hypothetical protein
VNDKLILSEMCQGSVSDGYHTIAELYMHRHALWLNLIALMDADDVTWKSRVHSDGTMFEGFFISGCELPTGRVTYHLPVGCWDFCAGRELEAAPVHDGHDSLDTVCRLVEMIGGTHKVFSEEPTP